MKTKSATPPQRATRSSTRGIGKSANVQSRTQTSTTSTKGKNKPRPRKQNIAAVLEQYHTQTNVDPNHSSIMFRYPRELFAIMTSYLPEEALISLSLTCKLALQLIGSDCWTGLKRQGRHSLGRKTLMKYFCRDSPGTDYCEYCNTLHPPLKPPRTHRETSLTKNCFSQWALVDYFPQVKTNDGPGYSLLWPHIKEAFDKGASDPNSTDVLKGDLTTTSHAKVVIHSGFFGQLDQ